MGFDAAQIADMDSTVQALQAILLSSELHPVSMSANMSNTVRWPTSKWTQASIALIGAVVVSVCVFIHTNNTHFARYAKQYPYDGQDGLGAMMDAFQAGAWTFAGAAIGLFALQRMIAPGESSGKVKFN